MSIEHDFEQEAILDQESREDPNVWVNYNGDEETFTIGDHHDDTDGDFKPVWKNSGGYRGYYECESDIWTSIYDDTALAMSSDCENLHEFIEIVESKFQELGIEYARVVCRTSNVFSANVELFVKDVDAAKKVLDALSDKKDELRDPKDFTATVLGWKD